MVHLCNACNKTYSSKRNLNQHLIRQPLCKTWISHQKNGDFIIKFVDEYESSDSEERNICKSCNKQFSNKGNLNRHIETNTVCDKWIRYNQLVKIKNTLFKNYKPFNKQISEEPIKEIKFKRFKYSWDNKPEGYDNVKDFEDKISNYNNFVKFESPKYQLCHIIWNIFVIDKEFPLTQEIIDENNVGYILAMLPDKKIYYEKFSDIKNVDHYIMEYEGNDMNVDIPLFDKQCKIIEEYRKERKNIFVFCNNGYQRSIPFLCHYLTKHHNDEVPTIEKAIDIILPQVDKKNYAKMRDKYIENMKKLFESL